MAKTIKQIYLTASSLQQKEILIQDENTSFWFKSKLTALKSGGYSYSFDRTTSPRLSSSGNPNIYGSHVTKTEFDKYSQDGMTYEVFKETLTKFK